MEPTEQEKQRLIDEFARRKRRQVAVTIPFVLIVVGALVFSDQQTAELMGVSPLVWGPVVVAVMVGTLVFALTNWRCPACNRYLGKGFNPRFCPKCGAQLKRN